MRVSKDKNDSAYDARERKVFLNDKEFTGEWVTADEFRRAIVLADGKALFGNVHIERLPELKNEFDSIINNIISADKVIIEGLTFNNVESVNFGESEIKLQQPHILPTIAETPKKGYSVRDSVKVKGKGK